ncbi:MAG: dipeptide ABC transporter ATP-binding protein [Holophaga sp.]|jgi:oligopeptide/dipeptide ABC transporter ATP-binding protein
MDTLLEVRQVAKHFNLKGGAVLKAVDGVSFDLRRGATLGVVGESGCGKSTLGKTLLRLEEPTAGSALLDGVDLFGLGRAQLKAARRRMQMIFQDPFSSLNPRRSASAILEQPLVIHRICSGAERRERVDHLMDEVGLDRRYRNRYPHQFSGGQRQRIGIARALALNPELIICDEAVSALDVSIQAQIINLLLDLQQAHGLTYIFIAHDLSVVEFISDRILVMYLGRIVEDAPKAELVAKRLHPYTQALFEASPILDPDLRGKRTTVPGDLPSPIDPPRGCHFHPRCPRATDRCREAYPERKEVAPGHFTACHLY